MADKENPLLKKKRELEEQLAQVNEELQNEADRMLAAAQEFIRAAGLERDEPEPKAAAPKRNSDEPKRGVTCRRCKEEFGETRSDHTGRRHDAVMLAEGKTPKAEPTPFEAKKGKKAVSDKAFQDAIDKP